MIDSEQSMTTGEDNSSVAELLRRRAEKQADEDQIARARAEAQPSNVVTLHPNEASPNNPAPLQPNNPTTQQPHDPTDVRPQGERTPRAKSRNRSRTAQTPAESLESLLLALSKRSTVPAADMDRLEVAGSASLKQRLDSLERTVYLRHGVKIVRSTMTALAVQAWLSNNPDLEKVDDSTGTANLTCRVPATVKRELLQFLYERDQNFPYSRVVSQALNDYAQQVEDALAVEVTSSEDGGEVEP